MSQLKVRRRSKSRYKANVALPYDIDVYRNDDREDEAEQDAALVSIRKKVVENTAGKGKQKAEEQIFEMTAHESNFFRAIRELWKRREMCDVVLWVEKAAFRCHKIALAACSEYFRELFTGHQKSSVGDEQLSQIPLLGIKSETVKNIIDAIYSAKIILNSSTVDEILSAASYLRMPFVVNACQSYLTKRLCIGNCIQTLQIAHLYDLDDLKEETYRIVCANFQTVSMQKEFAKLRYYELLSMIPREDIVVDSEITIFNAIARWTETDRSTRIPYVGRLMRHVRFPLMTESQLVDHVEGVTLVSEVTEVGELVREAVRYHLLPYRRSILQSPRTKPRTTFQAEAVVACGGLPGREDETPSRCIYYYLPETNKWNPLAEMPESRHHHAVAVLGGFLYVAGGDQGKKSMESSKKVWRYDAWAGEWLSLANMLQARQSFQLGVLDSRIYAVGGRENKDKTLKTVESYNPSTNAWTPMDDISSPRRHVALATLGGRLYAVGGSDSDLISRRVERFNPVSSQWERRHPLCKPRYSASLHTAKNRLWLVGGASIQENDPAKGVVATPEIEVYSPALDQWSIVFRSVKHISKKMTIVGESQQIYSGVENDARNVVQTCRTEAGSCILDDYIYLVAGYSWTQKDRVNGVERIDVSTLLPNFPKYATVTDCCLFENSSTTGNKKKQLEMTPKSSVPSSYPIRCTGVACAVLPLYKKPKFIPRKEDISVKPISILRTENKYSKDGQRAEKHGRIIPKVAFTELPANEKNAETVKRIGYPQLQIHASTRLQSAKSIPSNERETELLTGTTPAKQTDDVLRLPGTPSQAINDDEIDFALDQVIKLTIESWDDLSRSHSTISCKQLQVDADQESISFLQINSKDVFTTE